MSNAVSIPVFLEMLVVCAVSAFMLVLFMVFRMQDAV